MIGKLFKWVAGAGSVKETLDAIGKTALDIRAAITGKLPPEEQAKVDMLIAQLENKARTGQMEINKIEASSGKLFIAGWRPYIGWICGTALLWHYMLFPFVVWVTTVIVTGQITQPPELDTEDLITLLLGLLGLGGLRTFEKFKGVEHRR